MRTLIQKYRCLKRKKRHLRYMQRTLYALKYEILNDALSKQLNESRINLFHKYQKRYKLLTFMRR